ncbi:hypothetical protein NLX83_20425 [Allokutzneria sp. A3M-2-11 16]|uniref:hypothetical protein n=1 Tax=Allokutzneria sp. A3M-2-11 16 TaxID=2962043 RepID=UPI0020B73D83|nr:hypothetical protein [Allokutzneria sp. A3M-2-11 16]MCP3801631.1 hypothetical protein [Allokutzneria sp. A3M-2-11 16]
MVSVVAFGVAWWLGLYLIARDPKKPTLVRAGVGLLAYAAALAVEALLPHAQSQDVLREVQGVFVCVPPLAWSGVAVALLPEKYHRWWRIWLVPLGLLVLVPLVIDSEWARLLRAVDVLLPLVVSLGLLVRHRARLRPAPVRTALLVVSMLLVLSAVLVVLPTSFLPSWVVVTGMGVDLVLLGLGIAVFDAFDEGQAIRADMGRSVLTAAAIAVVFGGQVGLAMALSSGATLPLTALLLGSVAAAISVQVLANPLQSVLDRVAFADAPELRRARAELREAGEALPRRANDPVLDGLDDAEFAKLTRRALGNYGDLGRLVSSPLTMLPSITEGLVERNLPDQPLERANELKRLLLNGILQLKPSEGEFGTSDEWRYYNALYFPYVLGLRPYSRRDRNDKLDDTTKRALQWFSRTVPERTLYNWQNAAAKLVAAGLRQRTPR